MAKGQGTREQGTQGARKRAGRERNWVAEDAHATARMEPGAASLIHSVAAQVSAKALAESKLMRGGIDARQLSRYSQGQIPELVANTIPRSFQAAQSNCSVLPPVLRFVNSQQPAPSLPLTSLTPLTALLASARFAAQVSSSLPAVAQGAAAGFFIPPSTQLRRL
jgi:hypothetical protein